MLTHVYDVCIIGSGFAALFLALTLVDRGLDTVIVEAGPALLPGDPAEGRTDLFPHGARGDSAFAIDANRSIAVGGTSRRWNGVLSRFLPTDFRSQSEYGLFVDWPLAEGELTEYYVRAERALCRQAETGHEVPSCLRAVPGFERLGLHPLEFSYRAESGGPARLTDVEVPRFAASAHGALVLDRPVTRLVDTDGLITEARTQRPDGTVDVFRARHYVLAAGVVESVRLLLCSASSAAPNGLGNQHDAVGRFVHAHPRTRIRIAPGDAFADARTAYRSYYYADRFRRDGFASLSVDVNCFPPSPAVDLTVEMEPAANNRVRLDPSTRDGWGRPTVVLESSATRVDRNTRQHGRSVHDGLVSALLQASPGSTIVEDSLTWFHPAGGCRMGPEGSSRVVDRDCLVVGTDNLSVAGAAVFPTSGPTNPTLTIVALALRLGDHLSSRLGRTVA
jgi:glucose dehydrogenase